MASCRDGHPKKIRTRPRPNAERDLLGNLACTKQKRPVSCVVGVSALRVFLIDASAEQRYYTCNYNKLSETLISGGRGFARRIGI